jgi:hypothetical protein
LVLTILLTALTLLATTFVVVLVRAAIKRRTDAPEILTTAVIPA